MARGGRVHRIAVGGLIVAAILAVDGAPVSGDDGIGRRADATQDAYGNPTVVAMSEIDRPSQPGRRATGVVTCTWFEPSIEPDNTRRLPGPPLAQGAELLDDHLYYRHCENGDGEAVFQGWTRWTAAEVQILAADLAYEASRELQLPYPRPA